MTPVKGNTGKISGNFICGMVIATACASTYFAYRASREHGQDDLAMPTAPFTSSHGIESFPSIPPSVRRRRPKFLCPLRLHSITSLFYFVDQRLHPFHLSAGIQKMADFVPMQLDRAKEFLRNHHHGVLTTRRRNGALQMSPVTCGLDTAGHAIISSRETAYKVNNLRRDPRAALCVFSTGFHGEGWAQINGRA